MTVADLVADLADAGIQVWEEAGQLHYRAPRGAMTAQRRQLLRAHRAELVASLSRPLAAGIEADPAARHDPFPLTDVQLAYLLGRKSVFAYGGVGCHGYGELVLADLDPARLEAAWAVLIERHDMLRAVLSADGSQRVLDEVPGFAIDVIDVRGVSPRRATAGIEAVRADMSHRVYDPACWPLFDLRVTLADDRSILHFSIDLLIADFVSTRLLLDELYQLYREPDRALPPLDITFRDYVLGERQLRTAAERHRGYWQDRIDQLPPAPELPVPELAVPAADPGEVRFRRWETVLEPAVWAALRARAGSEGVTPSGCVLAAFAETVGRWSRSQRFTLDVTLLNRLPLHPQVAGLVGDFTSVDLLAVDQDLQAPLRDRARALQAQLWDDLDHRQFSGLQVMREIARRRGPGAALFPVVFTSAIGAEAGSGDGNGNGSGVSSGVPGFAYGITQTPQVWLDCQVMENQGRLAVNWDVRERVFPDGLIDDMFAAFTGLLDRLAAGPEAWQLREPVEVPATQAASRRARLVTAPPAAGLLQDGIVAAARRDPDRVAVITSGTSLTYGELLGRASGVAARLRQAGHAEGDIVGIVMDKGWEQVVAVLAVLLAGGAYLPVDTGQPAIRRDQILAGAGARQVLTQSWLAGAGVVGDGVAGDGAIVVDEVGPAAWAGPQTSAEPGSLAYVIYTSGSTGQPKGVMVSHRSAVTTIDDITARFAVTAGDRVLGLASLGFDLSVFDIFGLLGRGGAVVLPDAGRRGDPSHWARQIGEHAVTIWNSVPAQMEMLTQYLDAEPGDGLPSLRLALLSGDWIPVTLPGAIRSRWPGLDLISLGGATEAAIWSIFYAVGDVGEGWRSIPYGTPLTSQSVQVLDAGLRPCPDWTTGGLYIGGAGLAAGYLGDEEQTARRFIRHPRSGERLYDTGDLGRYLPGALIELLGREDRQVKIRGHRIELGEIEAAAVAHPAVGSAAVLVSGRPPGPQRLAAFVTGARRTSGAGAAGAGPTGTELADAGPPGAGSAGLGPAGVELAGAGAAAGRDLDLARYAEFIERLDRAALAAMGRALGERGPVLPRYQRLVRRWREALAEAGQPAPGGAVSADELARAWADAEAVAAGVVEPALLDYYRATLQRLPDLLAGRADPVQLLFPGGHSDVARALYEDAPASRWASRVVAAMVGRIAAGQPRPLRVLEAGAGVGATSAEVLTALEGQDVRYLLTELSGFFLAEARERFAGQPGIGFGLLDLSADYRDQGFAPSSWDVIVATDVLHAVPDLAGALTRLTELLAPGGWLVLTEMTRDHPHVMATLELMLRVGDDGQFADERRKTGRTFLSIRQWAAAITAAGGTAPVIVPGPGDPVGEIGFHVLATRVKPDRERVDTTALAGYLADRLPEYMLPGHLEVVDDLPLTANGKIDHQALLGWLSRPAAAHGPADGARADGGPGDSGPDDGGPGDTELGRRVAAIWADVLGPGTAGQSFFDLGGDSLLAARLAARLLEHLPETRDGLFDPLLQQILAGPTVAALTAWLASPAASAPDPAAALTTLTVLSESTGTGAALALVHDAGGGLASYEALVAELAGTPGHGPVLGLAVGDGDGYLRLDPDGLVERLAAEHARLLLAAGHRRLSLAGHGFGGVVALEVARHLAEAGADVTGLTLIGGVPLPGPDAPLPYAGDITLAWPADATADRAAVTGFWRDLCLGELQVLDIPGDLDGCLRSPSAAQLSAALTDPALTDPAPADPAPADPAPADPAPGGDR
jgi:pyochelin synthetase